MTVILVIATVIMAIATWQMKKATAETTRLTQRMAQSADASNLIAVRENMPVLNFRLTKEADFVWIVENVGKGVALNILLAHETPGGDIEKPIRDYNALQPGSEYRISWKPKPYKFVAQYTDIYGKRYTSDCERNVNRVKDGWLYGDWPERKKLPYWSLVVTGEITSDNTRHYPSGFVPSDIEGALRESHTETHSEKRSTTCSSPPEMPQDKTNGQTDTEVSRQENEGE